MAAGSFGASEEGPTSIEERITTQGRPRQDEVWKIYVGPDGVAAPLWRFHVRGWGVPKDVGRILASTGAAPQVSVMSLLSRNKLRRLNSTSGLILRRGRAPLLG